MFKAEDIVNVFWFLSFRLDMTYLEKVSISLSQKLQVFFSFLKENHPDDGVALLDAQKVILLCIFQNKQHILAFWLVLVEWLSLAITAAAVTYSLAHPLWFGSVMKPDVNAVSNQQGHMSTVNAPVEMVIVKLLLEYACDLNLSYHPA